MSVFAKRYKLGYFSTILVVFWVVFKELSKFLKPNKMYCVIKKLSEFDSGCFANGSHKSECNYE
jgi:hypothetical protein